MSHYPCLSKSFIQQFLDDKNQRYLEKDWKNHLDSNILNKYIRIKRQQDLKVAQILPKYRIFPKKYSQYNIYTSNYDLDRLQRMRNGQNQKYYQKSQIRQKNSKSQKDKDEDEYFKTTSSHLVSRKNKQNTEKEVEKSTLGFYDSKSARSLAQTNISPSRISKNINTKASSRIYVQSDSEASLGKISSNKMTSRVKFSKTGQQQSDTPKKQDLRIFGNAESLLSINAKIKNINKNEDYYQEDSNHINSLPNRSQKKTERHFRNQNQKIKEQSNTQQTRIDKKINSNQRNIKSTYKQKAKDKIRFRQSYLDDQKKDFKNESLLSAQNHQKVVQNIQRKNQSCSHNQKKLDSQQSIFTSSQLHEKMLEYYGQEFQRIKEQRDYLRKHFIEHLQKKHTSQLPYTKLTSIDVNQTGQKLIVHTQKIPIKSHRRVVETIEIAKVDKQK